MSCLVELEFGTLFIFTLWYWVLHSTTLEFDLKSEQVSVLFISHNSVGSSDDGNLLPDRISPLTEHNYMLSL